MRNGEKMGKRTTERYMVSSLPPVADPSLFFYLHSASQFNVSFLFWCVRNTMKLTGRHIIKETGYINLQLYIASRSNLDCTFELAYKQVREKNSWLNHKTITKTSLPMESIKYVTRITRKNMSSLRYSWSIQPLG